VDHDRLVGSMNLGEELALDGAAEVVWKAAAKANLSFVAADSQVNAPASCICLVNRRQGLVHVLGTGFVVRRNTDENATDVGRHSADFSSRWKCDFRDQ